MLERLTPEQELLLPIIRDKWIKIGLSTEPCNFEKSKEAVCLAYRSVGLKEPSRFYLCDDPISADENSVELGLSSQAYKWNQVNNQIYNQVNNQIYNQVWDQVNNQIYNQVWDQVWDQVNNQVWDQVRDQVWDQVWDQIYNQVRDQVYNQVLDQVYWLSFYDYFIEIGIIEGEGLRGLMELSKCCGFYSLYDDVVIFQHRPERISLRDGVLHNEKESAIRYRGGRLEIYCLNGVRVPEWLVLTKAEELDPRRILEIENVQIRAEFVRKVGIDRVCYKLGRSVDKVGDYELILVDFGDKRDRPYLKMRNPSVEELWHVEGVHPSCVDVRSALEWRNGSSEVPVVLT